MSGHDGVPNVSTFMKEIDERFHASLQNYKDSVELIRNATPDDLARLSQYTDFSEAHSPNDVLEEAADIFSYRTLTDHPKFMGFIPGPVSPLSVAGDFLISIHNAHAASRLGASGVAAIESHLIAWLAGRAGMPATAGGLFCSGASIANLTCLTVARDQKLDIRDLHLGIVYMTEQSHFSNIKALKVLGVGRDNIHTIPVDESLRLDVDALRNMVQHDREQGLVPFAVIASCGTTNTGAIDPLRGISKVAESEGLWMHVDGAYGASILLSNRNSRLADGIGLADSISWDAHKWLFQTYGCGMAILKDRRKLAETFSSDASYMRDVLDEQEVPNYWNMGIELTRPARAVKLWFTLRVLGVEKMGQKIDHGINLAEFTEREISRFAGWKIISPAQIGILVFRYQPARVTDEVLDKVNIGISQRLITDRVAAIFTTTIDGVVALRICTINPELQEEDVAGIITQANTVAQQTLKELGCDDHPNSISS